MGNSWEMETFSVKILFQNLDFIKKRISDSRQSWAYLYAEHSHVYVGNGEQMGGRGDN